MPEPISLELEPYSPKQSIATILAGLDENQLERLAIDVIREQRHRLEHAQNLFDRLNTQNADIQGVEDARHDYRLALLMMRAHHQIASAVIDKLGYVPTIPENLTEH